MENALLNLALNARDAMPGGGLITITTGNVELAEAEAATMELSPGQYSCVAVADTGSGMSEEVLEHVLEPFFTTKDVGEGSGLGLPMVYGFTKQSGGGLKIESTPGEGTEITLYLPRVLEDGKPAPDDKPIGEDRGRAQTVLVVEDDSDVRTVAVSIVSGLGYNYLEAANAQEALQVLAGDEPVDILFTDIIMPGPMRGTELGVEGQKLRPGLSVVLTTGYNDIIPADDRTGTESFGLLRKPYRRSTLAQALSKALNGR